MNTFKKATKRITTVAATAALVSSAVFGASLAQYPTNFVDNGEFEGQIVMGAQADAAAATSIIEDLASELSGDSEKVKITAKMTSTDGGDIVSALDDKKTVNYGTTNFATFSEELDDDSTDLLADLDMDGDDYTQTLVMGDNVEFGHKLFDNVDNAPDEAVSGLFLADGATYATYTLTFDSALDQKSGDIDTDYKGESITIMGNEFTVLEIANNSLTLVGGANKISLGEGESSTISVDGVSYEVEVQSVSTDKVLVTVNGESKSVDSDEVETVAGVTIGITEIVDSSRDAVKGYATLVIGGQKIELTNSANGLKINDDKISDIDAYDNFDVEATFMLNGGKEEIKVTYKVDENTLLTEGDSLNDILFGAFSLSYDGTNEVEYSELKLTSTNKGVSIDGNLFNGNAIPSEFELTTDDSDDAPLYLGSESERIFFKGSAVPAVDTTFLEVDGTTVLSGVKTDNVTATTVEFNTSVAGNDIKGQKFFTVEGADKEDMKLYEITSVVDEDIVADTELSFDELVETKSINDVKLGDISSDLDLGAAATIDSDIFQLVTASLATPVLYLENELMLDLTAVEEADLGYGVDAGTLAFSYNEEDMEADDKTYISSGPSDFTVDVARADALGDDALTIKTTDFGTFSEIKDGSDYEVAVDAFGTMVTIETEDYASLTIAVPDEEVYAKVSFNFGAAGSSVETYTVDAAMADAKVAELEEAGYTVTTEDVSSEAVDFDITAPVMADEVSGMEDMIVVGGPAVNAVAVALLGEGVVGVSEGEAVVRYFADSNSVLVYGWDAAGTQAAANKLNAGGLTGEEVNVQ